MKKSKPIVTVIVPFLNEEKYIDRCLASLLHQSVPLNQYELIFIDNGSTDKSASIVKNYKKVILLNENKRNVYAARNTGIKRASSSIIAFTDADCKVSSEWIAQTIKGISGNKSDLLLGNRQLPKKNIWLKFIQDYENEKTKKSLTLPSCYYFGYTNNMAVRSDLFKTVGLFKLLKVNGDTEFVQRVAIKKYKIHFAPQMKVLHLEVTSPFVWFRKMHLYGYHNEKLGGDSTYKAFTTKQSLGLIHDLAKNLPAVRQVELFIEIIIIALFYKSGSLRARL